MPATSSSDDGGSSSAIDLATATREELVQHVQMQRALIRALYDKIVALEGSASPQRGARHQQQHREEEDVDSDLDAPHHQHHDAGASPAAATQELRASGPTGAASRSASAATAAAREAAKGALSPTTKHQLTAELLELQNVLMNPDTEADLDADMRTQLLAAHAQIAGLLRQDAAGSSRQQQQQQQHSNPAFQTTTPVRQVARHHQTGYANHHGTNGSFAEERVRVTAEVERQGLASQYGVSTRPRVVDSTPSAAPGRASPTSTNPASRLAMWRKNRDSPPPPAAASTQRPGSRAAADGYTAAYEAPHHSSQARQGFPSRHADYVAAATPRPRTPTRRGMAPPLMGNAAGPGPRILSPTALQERVRARMDARPPPEPVTPGRVSPSSARRLRR